MPDPIIRVACSVCLLMRSLAKNQLHVLLFCTNIYLFPLFHDSFSLVTPFGNVDINLDFICNCQCEKDKNTVSWLHIIHVFWQRIEAKVSCSLLQPFSISSQNKK